MTLILFIISALFVRSLLLKVLDLYAKRSLFFKTYGKMLVFLRFSLLGICRIYTILPRFFIRERFLINGCLIESI